MRSPYKEAVFEAWLDGKGRCRETFTDFLARCEAGEVQGYGRYEIMIGEEDTETEGVADGLDD